MNKYFSLLNNYIFSLLKKEEKPTTETFLFELKKARQKELITQRTSVGPHRDEYSFSFNKKHAVHSVHAFYLMF